MDIPPQNQIVIRSEDIGFASATFIREKPQLALADRELVLAPPIILANFTVSFPGDRSSVSHQLDSTVVPAVTPRSAKFDKFIADHPTFISKLQIKHEGSFEIVGTKEYLRAQELLIKIDRNAQQLLEYHEQEVPYGARQVEKLRDDAIKCAQELRQLTGEGMRKVAHTSFPSERNRELWHTEFKRLEKSLVNAAYLAQNEAVKELERTMPRDPLLPPLDKIYVSGNMPHQVAEAVRQETEDLRAQAARPEQKAVADYETPISPRLQAFLRDNPGTEHHFVLPVGKGGVAFVGKPEFLKAGKTLDRLRADAEFMLEMHKSDVEPKMHTFQQQIERVKAAIDQFSALTGERPMPVTTDPRYLRKVPFERLASVTREELSRLDGLRYRAAYRAQDKQIDFLEAQKKPFSNTTAWFYAVKENQSNRTLLAQTMTSLAVEGETHPFVLEVLSQRPAAGHSGVRR